MPPGAQPAAPAPADTAHDPFATMKPTGGKMFDLRMVDDGKPAENVQAKQGKGALIITAILGVIAFGVGAGFGGASVGRRAFNQANSAAKSVRSDLENMQKTLNQIGTAVLQSLQRAQAAKKDPLAYDEQLVRELDGFKLDPRPDTSKIFRCDFFRLEDMVVDRLFNYYYDSIALYAEVERHVKRTKADQESLKSLAEKTDAAEKTKNYGVVFDQQGRLIVANLVEIGDQVCEDGGTECPAADLKGFKVRMNTGSNYYEKKAGSKLEQANVVPLKPTPLMDAVMSGSPDQVRGEAYKQRMATIRGIVQRLQATFKELKEGVDKAAARPDLFTLF